MGRLGTDVWALACITAGAAVGGAITLAGLEARDAGRMGRVGVDPCEVMVVEAPRVVVSAGGGELRVEPTRAPRIHVSHSCARSVREVRRRVGGSQP